MKIVAVTACPTGVAHTFMCATALKKAAKDLGHDIKVETQGAFGLQNKLTMDDIKNADLVIFAVDTKVNEIKRFEGKFIYEVGVTEPIKDAKKVINDAIKKLNSNNKN
ncbi:PTS fructose transporter subunit IIB [Thermoanaerobacter thermocopriae]|uniref:PTS fructose transporter subunit IIB n=1 Tax=Thermoanaerobacter thermocopriae TaxID=29350 RepID=UPI00048B167D|nr:PTS fructose transporter subunit IIB [Thermoanaerobacter thermocopriae]